MQVVVLALPIGHSFPAERKTFPGSALHLLSWRTSTGREVLITGKGKL